MNGPPNFEKWNQMARDFLGEEFWAEVSGMGAGHHPKADVFHGKNEVIVLVDLPGVADIKEVDIRIEGETLFVKGQVPSPHEECERIVSERYRGSFERVIPLGLPVSRRQSRASYRRGVLEIRLPTVPAAGDPKRIRISDS